MSGQHLQELKWFKKSEVNGCDWNRLFYVANVLVLFIFCVAAREWSFHHCRGLFLRGETSCNINPHFFTEMSHL